VGGLRDATLRLNVAANNVANAATEGFRPARVTTTEWPGGGVQSTITQGDLEGVDLPTELVAMILAQAAFTANARLLASTLGTEGRVLDLLA
jgi:flagellar hook protein FlgE